MANTLISIPLVKTYPHPCSYIENAAAQSHFVNTDFPMTASIYAQLIEHGFRRSGDDVYRPGCPYCTSCLSSRLSVKDFKPNRSQKRCQANNQNTQVVIKPPVFEQAHYDLYLRYQQARHCDGDMATCSPEQYIAFLGSTWCDTVFVEFSIDQQLVAVAVVDRLDNALSAVYTFFDPNFPSHSLGTYAVLWQIQHALAERREYVYLGFYIENSAKMSYKKNFQPMQLLVDGRWV
ncbi:arginyltransferase [Methylosoma difficile]